MESVVLLALEVAVLASLLALMASLHLMNRAQAQTAALRTQVDHGLMHLEQRDCTIDELRTELDKVRLSLASCRGEQGLLT